MNLEELKKLCSEATPGPWRPWWVITNPQENSKGEMHQLVHGAAPPHEITETNERKAVSSAGADGAFISAARDALPKLIAVAEASKAIRLMFCASRIWTNEECTLDAALAALEAE